MMGRFGNTIPGKNDDTLYCYYSNPILTDVIILNNIATSVMWGEGGGIKFSHSSPTLMNVTISGNSATSGGGMAIGGTSSNPILVNVTISGNFANDGAGINCGNGSNPTIIQSNISYNSTGFYNVDNTIIPDATNNYWGHSTGPYHPSQNPNGLGDSTNHWVNVTPWLSVPDTVAPPIPVQNLIIVGSGNDFVNLSWDAIPLGDLAGYIVYYNEEPTDFIYSHSIDIGSDTVYTLSGLSADISYYIALTCYDTEGNESWYSNQIITTTTQVSIIDEIIPFTYTLYNAFPNPFNPVTTLHYDLPEDANVNITIYDMMGRVVSNLVSSQQRAGYKSVRWNATNNAGQQVPAGLYLYTIEAGEFRQTKKMVLLK